ncbi:MAG TPA: hypothetical protein DCW60_03020 [Sutterella sp.]|nr:hypothetical protein [Sutterella sp.]
MSKPWEDSDFYQDDRFEPRRERWEPKRNERRWGDRDDSFGNRAERGFQQRKPRFASNRFTGPKKDYGHFSGPRAKAQQEKRRRVIDVNQEGKTVIVLDDDVARVFETAPEVNAALRKVIELAQILGPVKGAKRPEWLDSIQASEEKADDEAAPQTVAPTEAGYVMNSIDPSFDEGNDDIALAEAPQEDDLEIEEAKSEA